MFCYQCEQAAKGSGCTVKGVCGKEPEVSALMDLLIYSVKGLSMYAHRARELGVKDRDIDIFTIEALFTTVTNVNFDPERLFSLLMKSASLLNKAKNLYESACKKQGKIPEKLTGPAEWSPANDIEGRRTYKTR